MMDDADTTIRVESLSPAHATDDALAARLAALINEVYAVGERGLWIDGRMRTTPEEVIDLLGRGEIAVASRQAQIAGVIRIHDLDDRTGEFGMLAADPACRGIGIGSALVSHAERLCRERGRVTMQLELLVPTTWSHPSKEFLKQWYGRLG